MKTLAIALVLLSSVGVAAQDYPISEERDNRISYRVFRSDTKLVEVHHIRETFTATITIPSNTLAHDEVLNPNGLGTGTFTSVLGEEVNFVMTQGDEVTFYPGQMITFTGHEGTVYRSTYETDGSNR